MRLICIFCETIIAGRSIVLLTDGANLNNDYNNTVDVIRNGNKQFGNKVTIFVYSFNVRGKAVEKLQRKFVDCCSTFRK